MAFDQPTRNRLQKFVNDARRLLEQEFTRQLQNEYGLDPTSGSVAGLDSLRHLDDAGRETARILRATLAHYQASEAVDTRTVLGRIVREQAFTVLNRLAALRMAEARGLLIESVARGPQSRGFQLYQMLAGSGLGETGDTYRHYLFSVFDELAQDLPALFDRYAPQGRLFPKPTVLTSGDGLHPGLLELINGPDIDPLWAEDETIGWIYQYFNSKEERKKMRDESQAPRNSRELAVRNQFFTPRYVVEFLVDNTLGRLWFNATGGQTCLRQRCQYLLVKPDEAPVVASRLRDPRSLKLLDPACGSMHFGLYAFDLFAEIYREAWAWEQRQGPGSLDVSTQPQAGFRPLGQSYADEAAYLRDVPRMIIEHNIYGVDIDPRAAQIASLALWLRAQRAWHDGGVKAKDRPLVGRGQVVAAVAPPAEKELREQFAAGLDRRDAELFEKTLQLLRGLPELGVLLKLERELPSFVRKIFGGVGKGLFAAQEQEDWLLAEARLRVALFEFSKASQISYQGRLFSGDAMDCFRLIDLCGQRFDIAVTNPPFGDLPLGFEGIVSGYKSANIYSIFIERMIDLDIDYIGAITDRTFLVQPTFAAFRQLILAGQNSLAALMDLGWGVLDANVQVCAYVLHPGVVHNCDFADAREEVDKASYLTPTRGNWMLKQISGFNRLPQMVLAFTVPDIILDKVERWSNLESVASLPRGLGSNKAERTFRAWYEVCSQGIGEGRRWASLSNGGEFSPYWRSDLGIADWNAPSGEL